MRNTPALLTLWGCLSLSVACGGPDVSEAEPTLQQARAAVEGELGSWAMSLNTGYVAYDYRYPVRLKSSGEVLGVADNHVARYNPYNDTWRTMNDVCPLGSCRVIDLVSLSSGSVLGTVGINNRRGDSWSFKLHDPAADTWTDLPAASLGDTYSPYAGFSLTVLGSGRFLQTGGFTWQGDTSVPLTGAAEYDPSAQTWASAPAMKVARTGHRSVLLYNNKVLTLGGGSTTAEVYDSVKRTWTLTPTPPFSGTPKLAVRLNSGQAMVLVGEWGTPTTSVYFFDPYNNRWLSGPTLPLENPVNATLLYSGELLVTNDAGYAQLYDPAQGAWLTAARGAYLSNTFSVLLTSGQVFRLGGSRYNAYGQRFTR